MNTTVGSVVPLTFERFQICELFAELLHCSNMAILNRPAEFNDLYDVEGRLHGGLASLEKLAQVIALNNGDDGRDHEAMDETGDDVEPALELPVTGTTSHESTSLIDSDEDMSDDDTEPGSSDDDAMEEIVMFDEPPSISPGAPTNPPLQEPPMMDPSSPNASSMPPPAEIAAQGAALARAASLGSDPDVSGNRPHSSRRSARRVGSLEMPSNAAIVPGERMKLRLLNVNVLSTLLVRGFSYSRDILSDV